MSEIPEHHEHHARHERANSSSPPDTPLNETLATGEHTAAAPGGFRSQQRFSDPSAPSLPSTPVPAEWTAPTPPHGIPVVQPSEPEEDLFVQPPAPEVDLFAELPAPEEIHQPPPEAQPVVDEGVRTEQAPLVEQAQVEQAQVEQAQVEQAPIDEPTSVIDLDSLEPPVVHQPPPFGHQAPPFQPARPQAVRYGQAPLPPHPPAPHPPHLDLSTVALLGQPNQAPSEGWRKWLYVASFKTINVGESPKVNRRNALTAQVRQPLHGCYKIALLSLKGGVGKTTITATLGATIASIRGDRVVAVDANPDRGTLSQKVPLETPATVRHLLRDADKIHRYSDVRAYTSQGPSRLEVLASETDPAVSEAFSSDDYIRTLDLLERFYSLVLTDCGTGLMHSAMSAVLDKADALIVISSGSVDGARSASATLDWLDAHGHQDLVRSSVAVINAVRPRSGKVDMQKVVDHFSRRSRVVLQVPFDPHLEEGAEISLDQLKPQTREALIELAAVVADGFAGTRRANAPPA